MDARSTLLAVALLALTLPAAARVDYGPRFRCQGKSPLGMSTYDLLRYCGEPEAVERYALRGRGRGLWLDRYYYLDRMTGQSFTLEVEAGEVVDVIDGERAPPTP